MASKPGLLLTGASGFVGRHVIALGRGRFDIVATGRGDRPAWLADDVRWLPVDLLDRKSVSALPVDMPYVLHLAAETVPSKFSNYDPLLDSLEMTLNLCRHLMSGKLLFVSSCLVYGASVHPLSEVASLEPRGTYGLTKQLCEELVRRTSEIGGLNTAIARPFNHIGPGMRPELVIPSIVRRVRDAESGARIQMAGLDSIRDFLDVEDIVEAYFAILKHHALEPRVFNVASNVATSVGDIVRTVATVLQKDVGEVVFADQGNSGDDRSVLIGDAQRLREVTGWRPRIGMDESIRRLVTKMPTARV